MEGKKKFEKPELQVVEMKRNLLDTQSSCGANWCVFYDESPETL
jgi:hypothetical protein